MEVKNCRGCGRLFNYMGGGYYLCSLCKDELDKKFQDVKKYIRENPKATMQQISEDNEVSVNQIERWVREDRLIFADDSPIGIDCESCGAMMKSGRYCPACHDNLQRNLSSAYRKEEPAPQRNTSSRDKDRDRMRFLGK